MYVLNMLRSIDGNKDSTLQIKNLLNFYNYNSAEIMHS